MKFNLLPFIIYHTQQILLSMYTKPLKMIKSKKFEWVYEWLTQFYKLILMLKSINIYVYYEEVSNL